MNCKQAKRGSLAIKRNLRNFFPQDFNEAELSISYGDGQTKGRNAALTALGNQC
jgi:hypothetical protein